MPRSAAETTRAAITGGVSAAVPVRNGVADGIAAAILLTFAVLFLAPQFRFTMLNPDEGITAQAAIRVLSGQVPYREFFGFYTPVAYYLPALLFRMFGSSLLVLRATLLGYAGIFCAGSYLLARQFSSRGASIMAAFLLAMTIPIRFIAVHNWDSTLFAFASLMCLIALVRRPLAPVAFAAGACASLSFLIEQSKGVGAIVGLAAALLLISRSGLPGPNHFHKAHYLATVAGVAMPVAVCVLYFAVQHTVAAMLASWMWPLHHYAAANHVPFGFSAVAADLPAMVASSSTGTRPFLIVAAAPFFLVPAMPLLILLAVAVRVGKNWRPGDPQQRQAAAVLLAGGAVLVAHLIALILTGRADLNRIVHLAPVFCYLAPVLVQRQYAKPRTRIAAVLVLMFLAFGTAGQWNALHAHVRQATRRGTLRVQRPDETLNFALGHIAPGTSAVVYPYHPLYAFLIGTTNPTRFDYLQPGLHSPEQYREMADEMRNQRPAIVLLNADFASRRISEAWPSTPAEVLAHDPVEDYILGHFKTCAVIGNPNQWRFAVMIEKRDNCSQHLR